MVEKQLTGIELIEQREQERKRSARLELEEEVQRIREVAFLPSDLLRTLEDELKWKVLRKYDLLFLEDKWPYGPVY